MRKSNYDKFPATSVDGVVIVGWQSIVEVLQTQWSQSAVWAIDLYVGTYEEDFLKAFGVAGRMVVDVRSLLRPEPELFALTQRFMTDDVLFGYFSNVQLAEYFDTAKVDALRRRMSAGEKMVVVGTGAAYVVPDDAPVAYADMARWEIQQRFRRHEVMALGVDNRTDAPSLQYKRGYFNDWQICDRHKDNLMQQGRISWWIDSNRRSQPKMISDSQFRQGMERTVHGPFRVVPFFDPAPWGGQWMREVCDLPDDQPNYGWCFDCVPEENSLYLSVGNVLVEFPSQDVVLTQSRELLGERVWARFGKEFPIRFDFLDTMGGGNLSLQVHPTNEFSHREFGLHYTQDESYYLLDAGSDAVVYLGLKEGIDRQLMIEDLRAAQRGEKPFDAERYVNKFPAHKHDHYLIPAGTIHCSGHDSMVLEISATPSLFTLKLWDWNRLGLDGKPRPINVERGRQVIQWNRTTSFVCEQLCNHFEQLVDADGIREERTGLHSNEFIETRRHTFSCPVEHNTCGGVNVLNLVEGDEAVVESPDGRFAPFTVHYAETFIIPACVDRYIIRPLSGECKTIKAYVRV